MIQNCNFDMDGVIVDTEPVHHFAYYQHFKELNIDVSDEMYRSFTGNSTRNIFQKLKSTVRFAGRCRRFNLKENAIYFNEAFDLKEDLYLIDGVES